MGHFGRRKIKGTSGENVSSMYTLISFLFFVLSFLFFRSLSTFAVLPAVDIQCHYTVGKFRLPLLRGPVDPDLDLYSRFENSYTVRPVSSTMLCGCGTTKADHVFFSAVLGTLFLFLSFPTIQKDLEQKWQISIKW